MRLEVSASPIPLRDAKGMEGKDGFDAVSWVWRLNLEEVQERSMKFQVEGRASTWQMRLFAQQLGAKVRLLFRAYNETGRMEQ